MVCDRQIQNLQWYIMIYPIIQVILWLYPLITHADETFWCNSSTMNRTAYELHQRNRKLKVYCPQGNQLNVRLALARQTMYQVEGKEPSDYIITLQGGCNCNKEKLRISLRLCNVQEGVV